MNARSEQPGSHERHPLCTTPPNNHEQRILAAPTTSHFRNRFSPRDSSCLQATCNSCNNSANSSTQRPTTTLRQCRNGSTTRRERTPASTAETASEQRAQLLQQLGQQHGAEPDHHARRCPHCQQCSARGSRQHNRSHQNAIVNDSPHQSNSSAQQQRPTTTLRQCRNRATTRRERARDSTAEPTKPPNSRNHCESHRKGPINDHLRQ